MDRDGVRKAIEANMRAGNKTIDDLRVQADPFFGWRIAVVSRDFNGLDRAERRRVALKGLEDLPIQWLDLLTPEEQKSAGKLPIELEVEDLPLWAEALARGPRPEEPTFLSDTEADLDPPLVGTFYSVRGGVGRTTALAYTALCLASRARRSVLCVDMDLEAPGLPSFFGKEEGIPAGQGLLSVLLALDQGESPDIAQHVIRLTDAYELYCLPAGRIDADYARRLRLVDPEAWYREEGNPLQSLMEGLKGLPFKPDVVLIDARTGLTPLSAPLLFDLSDIAVVVFFPHPQAYTGTAALVRAITRARSRRTVEGRRLAPEPRFVVSPVPERYMEEYRRKAEDRLREWLSDSRLTRNLEDSIHLIPYREALASSDSILTSDEHTLSLFQPIADWFESLLPPEPKGELIGDKVTILESLKFSPGIAETQQDFSETFVKTYVFEQAMSPDKLLVLGRKGTGKTALFRWILEGARKPAAVIMCPEKLRGQYRWVPSRTVFSKVAEGLPAGECRWRDFWTVYTPLALARSGIPECSRVGLPQPLNELLSSPGLVNSEEIYLDALRRALRLPDAGLSGWMWLHSLDSAAERDVFLLFDGLDAAWGTAEERNAALEGLMGFILERSPELRRLKFKVLLRKDIWGRLRFQNKSHLDAQSVTLLWHDDKIDYARTVLKQALRSDRFRNLVEKRLGYFPPEFDWAPEEFVRGVWNLLVGERMKGVHSGFTLNWVWNRLADGSGDHSPRALFQLFSAATQWEMKEQKGTPYLRSILRPRALESSLGEVSEKALQALWEEFPQLEPLADRLKSLQQSHTDPGALKKDDPLTQLGLEVGLIAEYGTTEAGTRYRVPDLYLHALGMTRRGPR
ncbi:MAG: ParA family protein [Acetobacteraceae bacterium]|nr:ParA family protein [Acetobacteraceae bacterium]